MLHITSTEHGQACWQIANNRLWMESFTDHHSQAMAYRLRMDGTEIDIPNALSGVVYFGEADQRPELPFVAERFPNHRALWVAVEAA
ncbi:hypothetical protein [Nocardia iowensis]|uniref:Uncharacterized protein n=1 Tax=Nocardia iowensis TaxID=204891 RepID=A0ABX8RGL8_NOCIO|nr:hypothetical protein [Nocardia iowensis]QXN88743.1 hypothetical protein KV110_24490 [Nocardia iowensis]